MTELSFLTRIEETILSEMGDCSEQEKQLIKAVSLVFHNFVRILSYEVEKLQAEIAEMKGLNSMTNETVGHYASHTGSGYYVSTGKEYKICPTCGMTHKKTENHVCGGGGYPVKHFHFTFSTVSQLSDSEIRIRKEVIDALGKLEAELFKMQTIENVKYMTIIKDRLNLLWGSDEHYSGV